MRLPKKQRAKTWTYKEWYEQNKSDVNDKRRQRYHSDPAYREKVKQASRETRKRIGRKPSPRPKTEVSDRKRGPAKPRTVDVNGQTVTLWNVSRLLEDTGLHRITYNRWVESGVLPPYFIVDSLGRRWYPSEFFAYVRRLVQKRQAKKGDGGEAYWLEAFQSEATKLWRRMSKKMPDISRVVMPEE